MTSPRPPARRSLRTRLALFYAAGVYTAGIVVLAAVTLPFVGIRSAAPAHSQAPGAITGTGTGIGSHQLLAGSAVALALLIPVALAAGWLVAGRFLRPLRAITATAISAGNLHQRLDLGEPADELTELRSILDDLFARLQASFDAQRHFVANASHELRTPLAGLRTLLEVALADRDADADTLRSTCQEALALGEHQERLVRGMLALATSERGLTRSETFDLAQVTTGVLDSRRDQATRLGIDLTEHLAPALTAGDPRSVESLNRQPDRQRHPAQRPGRARRGHHAVLGPALDLTVTNSGPVVPDDEIQRLFQSFQRLASDRHSPHDGYGLGLAIVNAVAQAHHAISPAPRAPKEA
jgi:signal transduction histidine kinase